jgi:hypothetical protein
MDGTVVPLSSGWRNCLWDPRCLISLNPSRSRMAITSRGFRTVPMLRELLWPAFRRTHHDSGLAVFEQHFNNFFQIGL